MSRDFPTIYNIDEFLANSKSEFKKNWDKTCSRIFTLNDFDRVKTLGAGAFGRVLLVKHKENDNYYAIKVLDKSMIIRTKQLQHSLYEKKVLQSLRFPFLVFLEFCFKDNSNLYFAMPFVAGGEMFVHLRRFGKFDEELSKFYAAQVTLALEYLHYMDLVYRDLKPENIMIDNTGYVKITDMGFCKIVESRTWTLCGTPDYLAPEIILSKGYGRSVDWWAFGVLIFEMSAGYPPFYSNDHMKTYTKIVSGKYRNANNFSPEVKDLIYCLLQTDLTKRYGNMKQGVNDIKRHKWFKNIDWVSLINKKVDPPFVPKCNSPMDTSNFDDYEEQDISIIHTDKYSKDFEEF